MVDKIACFASGYIKETSGNDRICNIDEDGEVFFFEVPKVLYLTIAIDKLTLAFKNMGYDLKKIE